MITRQNAPNTFTAKLPHFSPGVWLFNAPARTQQLTGSPVRQFISRQLLDYDFTGFHPYKVFGRNMTFATPPAGALLLTAYWGLEGWRALRALERRWVTDPKTGDKKADHRELRDVLIRDTWGVSFYLYGLPIFNRIFLKWGQRRSGLKLGHGKDFLSYKAHEARRTFRAFVSDKGKVLETATQRYWANMLEGSHWGIAKAAHDKTLTGIPSRILRALAGHDGARPTAAILPQLSQWVPQREHLIQQLQDDARLVDRFFAQHKRPFPHTDAERQQLFGAFEHFLSRQPGQRASHFNTAPAMTSLQALSTLQQKALKALSSHQPQQAQRFARQWQPVEGFAAEAAKRWLTRLSMGSFGVVMLLIGLMPVWYNVWYTNREYERLQKQHTP